MPELPDVEGYCAAIRHWFGSRELTAARLNRPFLLRTVEPRLEGFVGRKLVDCERIGKRTVLVFEPEGFMVVHLMVAGRWRKSERGKRLPPKLSMLDLEFGEDVLSLTEAGSKRRASLHLVADRGSLAAHDLGGVDPILNPAGLRAAMATQNRTLKRALTDPSSVSGIGNAYSDEILHAARVSPLRLTGSLTDEEWSRVSAAAQEVLASARDRLARRFVAKFPGAGEVTAFRPEFAAHGKYGEPCPACGTPIARIRYAENETNYCPRCQNEGRILADRALSRLLKSDRPRAIEEA